LSNDNPDYLHLTAHKFSITCRTCGITETFYSELSVGYFRLKHEGHDLVEAAPPTPPPVKQPQRENAPIAPPQVPQEPPESTPVAPPPMPEEALEPAGQPGSTVDESSAVVKVERVIVDTRVSPRDGFPVIRVRGLKGDELLFVRLFKPEEAGKMRQFLGSGRYEDREVANVVFKWEEDVISFQDEPQERRAPVEARLPEVEPREFVPPVDSVLSSIESLTAEEAPAPVPEPPRAPEPPPRSEKPRRAEKRVVEKPVEEAARVEPPVVIEKPSVGERPIEKSARVEPPAVIEKPPMVEKPIEEPTRVEPPAIIEKPPVVQKPIEKPPPVKVEQPAAVEKPEKPKKNHETLLLAKSSYVQEGEESMKEAVRISKILRAFRWNVEPVYTIGVIVEDNLSIETNKGEISGSLVKKIENAGYKLSAVTATSSKPTAWFKRKSSPEVPLVDDPERTRQLERRVAELTKTLKEERDGASELKATWENRFQLLTRLVSSLREGSPEPVGEPDDSEPQPETDVTS
jgi:hypothetical protein